MKMVALVKSIDFSARHTQLGKLTVVPATSESAIKGSLLGKSGKITTTERFASFEAAR